MEKWCDRSISESFTDQANDAQRIDHALAHYLEMPEAERHDLIDDLFRTQSWRQFGYGSLILDPASDTDSQYFGIVKGWERGAFCKDRHYRGTPEKLGVTMGALPAMTSEREAQQSVHIQGVVMEIGFQGNEATSFTSRVIDNIKAFAQRETSLNPIYNYRTVDVETHNKGTVKAIMCAANTESPLYLGRDGDMLSLKEKAAVIATSCGVLDETNCSPRRTGMAYWRYIVNVARRAHLEIEPNIEQLVHRAEAYRQAMPDTERAFLESIESAGDPIYATPVFSLGTTSKVQPDDLSCLLEISRQKIGWGQDPLPQKQLRALKTRMGL